MKRPTFRMIAFMLTTIAMAIPLATLSSATPAGAADAGPDGPRVNLIRESEFDDIAITDLVSTAFQPGEHIRAWTVSRATVGVGKPFAGIVSGFSGRNLQFLSLKDPEAATSAPSGTVCQRITVDPSKSYKLRFASAAVSEDAGVTVRWNRRVSRFPEKGVLGSTTWTQHAFLLGRVETTLAKLCFSGSGPGYPLVDKIQVFAVTP